MRHHLVFILLVLFYMVIGNYCFACEGFIVKEGKPAATIVVAKAASQSAKLAAKEFNYHVEKQTGVRLPERTDDDTHDLEKVKGTLVLIGESKFTRRLGLKSSNLKRQEYLIRTAPKMLILMGRDKPGTGDITYDKNGLFPGFKIIENFEYCFPVEEIGSCYAVYDFLERYCGIRWFLPTDIGMVVPQRNTLTFPKIDIRRKPWTVYRATWPTTTTSNLYYWDRSKRIPPPLPERERNLWLLRMRMGGDEFAANHSTEDWPSRFLNDHPDYFADYYIYGSELKPRSHMALCYSNPGVLKQTIQDARDFFDGKLTSQVATISRAGDFFGVVPADEKGACQCPICKSKMVSHNDDFNSSQVSNYTFNFVNLVAREIKKTHPNRYISTLADNGFFMPPDFQLESNVAVMVCVQSQLWVNLRIREFHVKEIMRWGKKTNNLYIWEYYNLPQHRKGTLFPGFSIHRLADNIKLYHRLGVKGMFIELDYIPKIFWWANPMQDQINLYFSLKLLDNPTQNIDQLLDDFYFSFYGKAGKAIKEFVTKAEGIYNDPKRYPAWSLKRMTHLNEDLSWKYLCPPDTLKEFSALMKEAHELAENELEKSRVSLFDEAVFQMMKKNSETFITLNK